MRFILIDRILELEPGRRVLASKTFSPDEDFLADHFPGRPLVPGTLLTEAMAQAAGWLVASTVRFESWPLLQMIQGAKFRHWLEPGKEVSIEAWIESERESAFAVRATVTAGDRRVAEARLVFHLLDASTEGQRRDRMSRWTRETFRDLGGEAFLATATATRA